MKRILTAALLFICLFSGCTREAKTDKDIFSSNDTEISHTGNASATREIFAMDTYMSLTAYGDHAETAVDKAISEIKRLDALLSVGDEKSIVYRLNHGEKADSEDVTFLIERSAWLYENTDGAFDITLFPLMELWGFTGEHPAVPEQSDIDKTLVLCGFDKLIIENGTPEPKDGQGIDFGGIAKGYTSQRIMEIFREYGITSGVVSLGGNVQCYGTKPDGSLWRCGITDPDHPDDTSALSGVISVDDKAVITSGGYERYFTENGKTYHHIINPENGYPADSGLKSVTIVSADGTLADGLSTACFVMGKEKSLDFWREHPELFDMVLITNENEILVTEGLKENFSSRKDYTIIKK